MSAAPEITPGMAPERAREIAASLDLRALPPDFYANPYPVYQLLRETAPVKRMPDGSFFLTRYADLAHVYRDTQTFSSDKKVEFAPKYNHALRRRRRDCAAVRTSHDQPGVQRPTAAHTGAQAHHGGADTPRNRGYGAGPGDARGRTAGSHRGQRRR
jgi:cytochrome P450